MNNIADDVLVKIKRLACVVGRSEDEIISKFNEKKEELGGLVTDYGVLAGVASDYGIKVSDLGKDNNIFCKIGDVLNKKEYIGKDNVCVIGRVKKIFPLKEFIKCDGKQGKVARLIICDETGEITVVLWNKHAEILNNININDIIRLFNCTPRISTYNGVKNVELNLNFFSFIDINSEKNGCAIKIPEISECIQTIKEVKEKAKDNKIFVCVVGRIVSDFEVKNFKRLDGTIGARSSFFIEDKEEKIKIIVWDDIKNVEDKSINYGCVVKVKGTAKRNFFEEVEITTSSIKDIEKCNIDIDIPEPKPEVTLLKIGEIPTFCGSLSENEIKNVVVEIKGIVTRNFGIKNFEKNDGKKGQLCAFMLNDDTGSVRVVAWGNATNFAKNIKEGDAVEIKKGIIKKNMDKYEVHLWKESDIITIDKNDFLNVKTNTNSFFSNDTSKIIEKNLSDLSIGDKNVRVVVKITDVDTNQQLFYPCCVICGARTIVVDGEYFCEKCGKKVDQIPKLILITKGGDLVGKIKINVVFFEESIKNLIDFETDRLIKAATFFGKDAVIKEIKNKLQDSVKILIGCVEIDKNTNEKTFFVDKIV